MRRRGKGGQVRPLLLIALLVVWGVVLCLGSGKDGSTVLRAAPSRVPTSSSPPAASGASPPGEGVVTPSATKSVSRP